MRLIIQNSFFLNSLIYLVFFLEMVSCNLLPSYTINQSEKRDMNFQEAIGKFKEKEKEKENSFEMKCLKTKKKMEFFFQFHQDEKYVKQILFDSPYLQNTTDAYEALVKISLFHFIYNPHRVSFRSNWQVFVQENNKDYYMEITPKINHGEIDNIGEKENYFFDTLAYLLQKSEKKVSLKEIINEFERNFFF